MSDRLIRWLCGTDPEARRRTSARLLIFWVAFWPLGHVGLVVLPLWFFQHVLLALSVYAVVVSHVDVLLTSDVRVAADDADPTPD